MDSAMTGPAGNEEPSATISGIVVDSAGTRVGRAIVAVCEEVVTEWGSMHLLAACGTDDTGSFELIVSAGPALVVALDPYSPIYNPPDLRPDRVLERGKPLQLTEGELLAGLRLVIPHVVPPPATIEAQVVDGAGRPVPGAVVLLREGDGSHRSGEIDGSGSTRFTGRGPGSCNLVAAGSRRYLPSAETPVEVPPGGTVQVRLVVAARGSCERLSLRLRCEDEDGRGIPAAKVRLDCGQSFFAVHETGADGTVELDDLPGLLAEEMGTIWVSRDGFDPDGAPLVDPDGHWNGERTVRLVRSPARAKRAVRNSRSRSSAAPGSGYSAVTGVVVDRDGVPVVDATVSWVSRGASAGAEDAPERGLPLASSREGGRYVAGEIAPGPARLFADYQDWIGMGIAPSPAPLVDVDLVSGELSRAPELRLPFAFADLARLTCRVVDEDGQPRAGMAVTADRCVGWLNADGGCDTGEDGRTTLRLFPGTGSVNAWETETHEAASGHVTIGPGEHLEIELRTPRKSANRDLALEVAVIDEDGTPVAGAEVHLSTQEGGVGSGTTDAAGVCRWDTLPRSLVAKELHISSYADGFYIGAPGASIAAWPDTGPARAFVVLRRPLEIRVRVTDHDTGAGVPHVQLAIQSPYSSYLGGGSRNPGEWETFQVLPGEVVVRARAPGFAPAEERRELVRGEEGFTFDLRMRREDG